MPLISWAAGIAEEAEARRPPKRPTSSQNSIVGPVVADELDGCTRVVRSRTTKSFIKIRERQSQRTTHDRER